MSYTTLMTLTVIEVLLLVVVLAGFLIALTRRLESIAESLSKVSWGVRAVEVEVGAIGPSVERINGLLVELTDDLFPGVAKKAAKIAKG